MLASAAVGQDVVPVGKGSYASAPPAGISKGATAMASRTDMHIVDLNGRPIPTNSYWANIVSKGNRTDLWTYPMNVQADPAGTKLYFATEWKGDGKIVTESPLKIVADGFKPSDIKAKDWTDWTLTYRAADGEKFMDFTVGEGMPYVWVEPSGVTPQIVIDSKKDASFFNEGGALSLPKQADHIGVTVDGKSFGLFAPDGTKFSLDGKTINLQFAGAKGFLVVCPLAKTGDLGTFYKHAYAIPRKAQVTWSYDPAAAEVATTWTITTEPLKGTETQLIQGWIPHHYRTTRNDLKFSGIEYRTPRGMMKCAIGNAFHIAWPFRGIAPVLPAPKSIGGEHDFIPDRMKQYLSMASERTKYGADTYWGAKDFLQMSHYMEMANQLGDPSAAKLQEHAKTALVDWFTYTPGEKEHFFVRYDNWKGMIGLKGSYGSEEFTDNHFHYGYFTYSASKLAMVDESFKTDYGPMARLVAKQYANWDRKDQSFPLFRTFDLWAGHSWAGGNGSGGGNNQESSSEAVQSWIGLFQLGSVLEDNDMTAAGAMGYAMETQATMEYWFNQHGDVFPPTYSHPIVGMVWSGGQVYGTYFSGDPAWIFAIQWLPWSPGLSFISEDRAFAKKLFDTMMAERKRKEKKPEIETTGSGLGNVLMTFSAQFDPEWTAQQMDAFWESNNPIAKENDTGGMTYYWTHSLRGVGFPNIEQHLSVPTSGVYTNEKTHVTTYVAYNPKSTPQTAIVYRGKEKIGSLLLPPRQITTATKLLPVTP